MTGYLTGLTMRNRQDGRRIRPRLPSRYEHAGWTVRGVGAAERAIPPNPRPVQTRLFGPAQEETEYRENPVQYEPGPSPYPPVRGPAAFLVPARIHAHGRPIVPDANARDNRNREPAMQKVETEPDIPRKVPSAETVNSPDGAVVGTIVQERPRQEDGKTRPAKTRSLPKTAAPTGRREPSADERPAVTATIKTRPPATFPDDGTPPLPARIFRRIPDPEPSGTREKERKHPKIYPETLQADKRAIPVTSAPAPAPERIRPFRQDNMTRYNEPVPMEPAVQITIGRIDVRSVQPQQDRGRRNKAPELDLQEYLKQPAGRQAR
jgi:hypothetical protein